MVQGQYPTPKGKFACSYKRDSRTGKLTKSQGRPTLVLHISTSHNEMSTITATALQSSYPPILPLPFNANQPQTIRLYPLSNYTFGTKENQPEEDPSVQARLKRLEEH